MITYISMTATKNLPLIPDPLGGGKDQIFKGNNLVSCQYFFTEVSHADKGKVDKHRATCKHICRPCTH